MPRMHHKPIKLKSFDDKRINRIEDDYISVVCKGKPMGDFVGFGDIRTVKLKGKAIKLSSVYYDEGASVVTFLLDYNGEKYYLGEKERKATESRELKNAEAVINSSRDMKLTFIGLGMGTQGLMAQTKDKDIFNQLEEQLGSPTDNHVNDEAEAYLISSSP